MPKLTWHKVSSIPTRYFLGYSIYNGSPLLLKDVITSIYKKRKHMTIACINPHSYVLSRVFPDFRKALFSADFLVCDGIGFYLACKIRLLNSGSPPRITGRRLLADSIAAAKALDLPVISIVPNSKSVIPIRDYFLANLNCNTSCLVAPYASRISIKDVFKGIDEERMLLIPHVIYIFISAPKQEILASEIHQKYPFHLIIPIGGVYEELYDLNHPLPPNVVLKSTLSRFGLEWLARFILEPRRMSKRLFISSFIFINFMLAQLLSLPIKKFLRRYLL